MIRMGSVFTKTEFSYRCMQELQLTVYLSPNIALQQKNSWKGYHKCNGCQAGSCTLTLVPGSLLHLMREPGVKASSIHKAIDNNQMFEEDQMQRAGQYYCQLEDDCWAVCAQSWQGSL